MQRHLKATVAQPTLSVEEEAIFIDEHNQSTNDLVSLAASIVRIEENNEIMIDVQDVLAQTPEVGPTEQALLEATGDMAIAGDDVAEGDNPWRYRDPNGIHNSNEGFFSELGDRLKKVWEAILRWLNQMWQSIKKFFTGQKAQDKVNDRKAEKVVAKEVEIQKGEAQVKHAPAPKPAEAPKPETPDGFFKFKNHKLNLGAISMPDGKVPEGDQLVREVNRCMQFAATTFDTFAALFLASTKYLLDVVNKIDEDNAEELMEDYIQFYVDQQSTAMRKLGVDVKAGEKESYQREEYLGDLTVKLHGVATLNKDEPLFQRMVKLRAIRFEVTITKLMGGPDTLMPVQPGMTGTNVIKAMEPWRKDLCESSHYMDAIHIHEQATDAIKDSMKRLVQRAGNESPRDSEKTKKFYKTIMMLQHVVQSSMARDAALFVDLPRRVSTIVTSLVDYMSENCLERAKLARAMVEGLPKIEDSDKQLKTTQDVDAYMTK